MWPIPWHQGGGSPSLLPQAKLCRPSLKGTEHTPRGGSASQAFSKAQNVHFTVAVHGAGGKASSEE